MRTESNENLINALVLVGKLQALSIRYSERETLIASNNILNRVINELVAELQAERTAAATISKVAK